MFGLLPQAPQLHVERRQIDAATGQVTLRVRSTQTLGHCPVCRCPTWRSHSRYTRTVADLPWAHYCVVFQLRRHVVLSSPKSRKTQNPSGDHALLSSRRSDVIEQLQIAGLSPSSLKIATDLRVYQAVRTAFLIRFIPSRNPRAPVFDKYPPCLMLRSVCQAQPPVTGEVFKCRAEWT